LNLKTQTIYYFWA